MRKGQRGRRREITSDGRMQCIECEQWLLTTEFVVHEVANRYRAHDSRCDWCRKAACVARNHNITVAEYRRLLDRAGGHCDICGDEFTKPNIDHSHSSGCILGVLCARCNGGIGCFLHDPARLLKAAAYLAAGSVLTPTAIDEERKRRMATLVWQGDRRRRATGPATPKRHRPMSKKDLLIYIREKLAE